MKKSIRIAAALCAAVFALPVLAGCDFINGDKSKDSDEGENPFVGKTIVYEDTEHRDNDDGSWVEDYDYISMTFTTGATGKYLRKWEWTSSSHEYDEEETEEFPFTYSLGSANGKNFLRVLLEGEDEEIEHFLREYEGVSEQTKELLVEREMTEFVYYEFGENDTVKINERYYAGDIAKSRESFENVYDDTADEYVEIYFRREFLRLELYKKVSDEYGGTFNREKAAYWGIPEFSDNGKDFTVEMYSVAGREDECTYTPVGTLKGNYDIPGMTTTSKCSGKIYFTEFPNEMKGVFATSYSVQNWDARHDAEEHNDWVEYKIVTE